MDKKKRELSKEERAKIIKEREARVDENLSKRYGSRRYSFFGGSIQSDIRESCTFYMTPEEKATLRDLAIGEGMTMSNYLRHLVNYHFEERRELGDI